MKLWLVEILHLTNHHPSTHTASNLKQFPKLFLLKISKMILNHTLKWYQVLGLRILSQGPMPKHIAIIMDGNRRYARENKLASVGEGHRKGADTGLKLLGMMIYARVKEVTMYAFSLENFKRSKEEVAYLMNVIQEHADTFLNNLEELRDLGICIEVVGDWTRIPEELMRKMARLMLLTKEHRNFKINIAFAYTARDEIARGGSGLIRQVCKGDYFSDDDINEHVLEAAFTLHPFNPVDILIRTSGESRLSDFLLWQTTDTFLMFVDVAWPEFSSWNLLGAIIQYQRHASVSNVTEPKVLEDHGRRYEEIRNLEQEAKLVKAVRDAKWATVTAIVDGCKWKTSSV